MVDPERWRRADRLLQSVLDLPLAERAAYLRQHCSDDPDLIEEVQSLVDADARANGLLDKPAVAWAAHRLTGNGQSETVAGLDGLPGQTISHFRVERRLGGGGMGVVYKAEDTRLHRPVALKFVSNELASTPEALSRFRREARAASALNHPNICTIYDIGEQDGRAFIAMEFLDGATIAERLKDRPLDRATALSAALDVLDALDAAHAADIVHRDIKPANLFLTRSGRAKVLDFGVAKYRAGDAGAVTISRTETAPELTAVGSAIGTRAYMSPEQLRGDDVDTRSDLFSFGVVLHEMITGVRPSQGESAADRRADSPADHPLMSGDALPVVPRDIAAVIARCLATRREDRYQRASEVRDDLLRLRAGRDATTTRHVWGSRGWRLAAAAALLALVAGAFTVYRSRPPLLTDRDTIILANFENRTGDPVFDDVLRQGLSMQLGQSPYLSVVSDERIRQHLRFMGQPTGASLTPDLAREVCERNGSAAMVSGSIAPLGTRYVLGLRAEDCSGGDVLLDEQAQAGSKDAVLDALSQMAQTFRARVGESLASVERYSVPLPDATTRSLEALKAYASQRANRFIPAESLPLLQRATELDPEFAIAHAELGITYSNLGESERAVQSTTRAYELRDRVSAPERFFITAMFDRQVTGHLERLQQTYEAWANTFPRDANPHALLAGYCAMGTGQYELAVTRSKRAIELDPDKIPAYASLAFAHLALQQRDAAEGAIRQASARGLESSEFVMVRYFLALLAGDREATARQLSVARATSGVEDWLTHAEGLAAAREGRLDEARRLSRLAADLAHESGRRERAALFHGGAAVWEALVGDASAARRSARDALAGPNGRDIVFSAAFALARIGDSPRARELAADLARRFPEDTSVRFNYLPILRAQLALNESSPHAALEALEPARRFDLALHGAAFNGFFGALYSVYLRGEALLAAGQPEEAGKEFRRVMTHRGLVLGDPIDALARLQVARAAARAGETTEAKRAYDDVLAVWATADRDVHVVNQAQAEHATLR
jgi:eukaryotic-like serine/threonine-protein kinase